MFFFFSSLSRLNFPEDFGENLSFFFNLSYTAMNSPHFFFFFFLPPPTQNHPPLREIREKGVFLGFFRVFSALSKHGKSLQDNKILSKVKKKFFNRFREVEMCDSPIFFGFFRILFLIFSATHNTHTKENA